MTESQSICIEPQCGMPVFSIKSAHWCEYHYRQWRYGSSSQQYDPVPPVGTLKKFNLTRSSYLQMYNAQDGLCAICLGPPKKKRLCIDHDHACCPGSDSCGKCVRGLLCNACNVKLAVFESGFLALAMEYIDNFKARAGDPELKHALIE